MSEAKPFDEIPEIRARSRGRDPAPFDPLLPTLAIHTMLESPIYRFRVKAADGDVSSVWINDPDEARRILVEEEGRWRKGQQTYEPFSSLVPLHLISLEGNLHAHMRRRAQAALGDALSSGRIHGEIMGEKLIGQIRKTIANPSAETWMGQRDYLDKFPVLAVQSVDRMVRACALDIVTDALFGKDWGVVEDYTPSNRRAYALLEVMQELHWRVADFTSRYWRRDRRANGAGSHLDVLDGFVLDEIEKSRARKANASAELEPERMLDAWSWDEALSTEEVRNLALTFLTMGSENVSTALSWCLIQLAENPAAQSAARASFESLSRCFDETIRLYPSVPVLTRSCPERMVVCGFEIPRSTEVVINLYAIHRATETWGAASANFDHTRCPAISTNGPPDAMPFGAGTRACVGRPLTNHELRCVLFPLIQAFEVTPVRRDGSGRLHQDPDARTTPNNFVSYRPGPHLIAFRSLSAVENASRL